LTAIKLEYYEKREIRIGQKYSIEVYEKVKEEEKKKRKKSSDPVEDLMDLLSDIEERYKNSKGYLIVASTKVRGELVAGATISSDDNSKVLLFPDIAKLEKITILRERGEGEIQKEFEWKPEKEYYVFDTTLSGIEDNIIILLETSKGARLITPEEFKSTPRAKITVESSTKKRRRKRRKRKRK